MRLVSNNQVSLYNQLKEVLIDRIKNGIYQAGFFIPSESKMIAEFGVSITTVRKTINDLVSMGLLEKIHGKGTRVISKEVKIDISSVHSLSEDVKKLGFEYKREVLEFDKVAVFSEILEMIFNLQKSEEVYKLKRINFIDDCPSALIVSYYPVYLGIKAGKNDFLNNSIYDIFKRNGHEIIREEWKLKAEIIGKDDAKLLEIDSKTPVMTTDVIFFDKNLRPVMVSKEYLRSDKFYISLSLNKISEKQNR